MKTLALAAALTFAACSSSKSSGTTGGSVGTSGTTGTNSGGTTSGGDPTMCSSVSAGGGQPELTDCNYNADCTCPATCTADPVRAAILSEGAANPQGKYCELGCLSNSDCDLPSTVCRSAACVEVPCGLLDDAGTRDDFGYACDAMGTNDGTCFGNAYTAPFPGGGNGVSLTLVANGLPSACWLGGTATTSCEPFAPPASVANRCGVNSVCVPSLPWDFATTGQCLATCDPSVSPPAGAPSCAASETCVELPLAASGVDPYGICVTRGDGGCAGGVPTGQSELQGCFSDDTCACPEVCVPLPDAGAAGRPTGACELPCTTSADCPNPTTQCIGGLCGYETCTGLTCAFGDAGEGTCLPPSFSWFAPAPFCVAAGAQAAGEACTFEQAQAVVSTSLTGVLGPLQLPGVQALASTAVCAPGLLCVSEGDGGSSCAPACTADGGSCGDGGLICYPLDATGFGFCGVCSAKALPCSENAQCCSGSCAPSGSCD